MLDLHMDEQAVRRLVQACQRRAAASLLTTNLTECANLAPAGTGSLSLVAALNSAARLAGIVGPRNVVYRHLQPYHARHDAGPFVFQTPLVQHRHYRRPPGFLRAQTSHGGMTDEANTTNGAPHGRARCLVMTVRDPADRLESAFRDAFGTRAKRAHFGGG